MAAIVLLYLLLPFSTLHHSTPSSSPPAQQDPPKRSKSQNSTSPSSPHPHPSTSPIPLNTSQSALIPASPYSTAPLSSASSPQWGIPLVSASGVNSPRPLSRDNFMTVKLHACYTSVKSVGISSPLPQVHMTETIIVS